MSGRWCVDAHPSLVERAQFNEEGLIPCIAQDASSQKVLMVAWMDKEALTRTLMEGRVTYFSRSRREYWRKGDTSGNTQVALSVRLDCDGDVLLAQVEQAGPACHTGAHTCFDSDDPDD
jgi:phosphoribosyl-AMP cyclohydrolase